MSEDSGGHKGQSQGNNMGKNFAKNHPFGNGLYYLYLVVMFFWGFGGCNKSKIRGKMICFFSHNHGYLGDFGVIVWDESP